MIVGSENAKRQVMLLGENSEERKTGEIGIFGRKVGESHVDFDENWDFVIAAHRFQEMRGQSPSDVSFDFDSNFADLPE